jgi:hypothetical protein
MENPKRARSWKRRLRPRVNLKNDVPVLYSTAAPRLKHSAAIGEALSEQVIDGKSKIDVSSFSLKRFKDLIK